MRKEVRCYGMKCLECSFRPFIREFKEGRKKRHKLVGCNDYRHVNAAKSVQRNVEVA